MKNIQEKALLAIAALLFSAPVFADTTVKVQGDQVRVEQSQQPATPVTTITTTRAEGKSVVIPGDYDIEGDIISVDHAKNEIVVRNILPTEKRIKGDPGIVSTLRVGDHVRVDMRGSGNDMIAHRIIEVR